MKNTRVVTVCDREADLYDFFRLSHQLDAAVLVRGAATRRRHGVEAGRFTAAPPREPEWVFSRTSPLRRLSPG